MSEARLILFRREGYFELEVPYNVEFIDELKRSIETDARYFQPARKRWCVDIEQLDKVKALAKEHFEYVSEVQG